MAVDLGNLTLGIQVSGLNTLTALETQLNRINLLASKPLVVTADTSAATGGMANLEKGALAATAAITALTAAIGATVTAGVALDANLEQSQVRMTALLGSASAATQMMTQLEAVASKSTFGLSQIQSGAAQLLAYGTAASNVIPILDAVQNATAAAGGNMTANFNEITRVLGELNGGLPLTERQLRQLVNAGLPLAPLAQQLGITTEALLSTGKTGEVTGQQLVTAFEAVYGAGGRFGDQMQKQTETLNGSLQVIKTNVSLLLADSFKPLFDVIRDIAVRIGEFTQSAQFSAWSQAIQRDVGAVIDVFRSLATALEPIGAALANFFGLQTTQAPKTDIAYTVENYTAAQNAAGLATQASGAALVDYAGNAAAAKAAVDALTPALDANKLAMMENQNAIAAVQDQYDPQKSAIQGQIDAINALSPQDINDKIAMMNLNMKEIQLKLGKPDTTALDAAIEGTQDKITQLQRETSSGLQASINQVQQQIRDVGLGATDTLDINLANLKQQLLSFTDDPALQALNQQIDQLKAKLAIPLDTTTSANQLTSIAAQLAAPGANRAGLLGQYGDISRQRQAAVDQNNQQKTALSQLEAQAATIKAADAAHATALNDQIHALEAQKVVIDAANKAERDGLQTQLNGLQDQQKAWQTAHDAQVKGLQDTLNSQQEQKKNVLADYTQQLAANTAAKDRLQLEIDQSNEKKAQLALPLETQLKAINVAEQAALAPLQERTRELQAQSRELAYQKLILDQQKTTADQLAAANKRAGGGGAAPPLATAPSGGPYGTGNLGSDMLAQTPDSPFVKFLNAISTAIAEVNKVLTPFFDALRIIGDLLVNTVIPQLGLFYDWLKPKIIDALDNATVKGKQFSDWLDQSLVPILNTAKPLLTDINNLLNDFANISARLFALTLPGLKLALDAVNLSLQGMKTAVDLLREPLTGMTQLIEVGLHNALDGLHKILDGEVESALGTFITNLGESGVLKALGGVKDWIDGSWGAITKALVQPFTDAWAGIAGFFNNLAKGVNWLAEHFKLPTIAAPDFGQTTDTTAPGSWGGSAGGGGGTNYAAGTLDSGTGHFAMVGERGPELMFVPQHSSIIPNHMLPGHADGFNLGVLDDAVKSVGGAIQGMGAKLVDTLMGALGVPDTSGVLPGLGAALVEQVKKGLLAWIAPATAGGRATAGGTGFRAMNLSDYLAYLGAFGGPLDNESAFNDLESVGQEHNLDPRWFMAIMQTENGFGTAPNDRLPSVNNYGGMGVNNRGFSFDSGIHATDGGPEYAGYASFHDFLEDEAGWIAANGTSFAGYQTADGGQGKNAAFQAILAAIPVVGAALAGGGGAGAMDDMINFAEANSGQRYVWGGGHGNNNGFDCSGFVAAILDAGGIANPHGIVSDFYNWMQVDQRGPVTIGVNDPFADPTVQHMGIGLNGQWYEMGGRAGGSGRTTDYFQIHGTPPGAAGGAFVTSPTLIMSGEGGDREGEITSPIAMLRKVVSEEAGSSAVNVTIGAGAITIVAPAGVNGRQFGSDFADGFLVQMRERGRVATR